MAKSATVFPNPFRPGAGHMPPYLAGRVSEEQEFRRLLKQTSVLENMILTGLRGVGKTVLLEKLKPIAIQEGWLWVGTDLSETVSLSEANLATRIITDLSVVTSAFTFKAGESVTAGFNSSTTDIVQPISYGFLMRIHDETPGLVADKIKAVLEFVWTVVDRSNFRGVIFSYDEAQNLSDHAQRDQYPLSLMLEVFQSIQRKNIPFMLLLAGLPTLFPKLVEARTYAERMFRVVSLTKLADSDCEQAIERPVNDAKCPLKFDTPSVQLIVKLSGGYPYFIQFICREVFDIWIQRLANDQAMAIPSEEIVRKLDTDFFAGRWAKATDRQRELLFVVSHLQNEEAEFTVQEIVEMSDQVLPKGFSSSHISQMFVTLTNSGLIYKNRHGRYSFAVPLMGQFIQRQTIVHADLVN